MFGTFRLALALLVAWYHLVDREFAGPIAVFGFFCLSGYLMTSVINGPYSDGAAGFLRYLANRVLRIYPTYWLALAMAAITVAAIPEAAMKTSGNFTWPDSPLTDVIILGHAPLTPSLLPHAWSLHTELLFYIAMAVMLARWRVGALLWLIFSAEITVMAVVWRQYPFSWFQFSVPAASLAFATGSALFHYRHLLPRIAPAVTIVAAVAAIAGAALMPRWLGTHGGLYLALAMTGVAVAGLSALPRRRWDSALGDLAYPFFLLHYVGGAFALQLVGEKGLLAGAVATAITLPLCWVAVVMVERPIQGLRSGLRRAAPHAIFIAK